jgi:hypothetical protein
LPTQACQACMVYEGTETLEFRAIKLHLCHDCLRCLRIVAKEVYKSSLNRRALEKVERRTQREVAENVHSKVQNP